MFEEKDYFMKIVQQFTTAIGRIMGLKAENKIEESQEVLSDTLKYLTNLDKEVLEALPYEILIHKMSGSRQLNTERCLMLSELLKQQGDIYEIQGHISKARNLYLKSLDITISVLLEADSSEFNQNHKKVDELAEKTGRFVVPAESKLLLFQYYELAKSYAKAEDVLFDLLETSEVNDELLAQGRAFYERLLEKDHTELENGNLPLNEVLEGLENLREYRQGTGCNSRTDPPL